LEDLDVDGRIILKCILKELYGCVDWIDLAQNRGKWRGFVKKRMNHLCSVIMCEIPWLAAKKISFSRRILVIYNNSVAHQL
jgi:hypothetical protein